MVYTDRIHLMANSIDELHDFAQKIGLKKEWFQNHPKHPHYDLFGIKINLAIQKGAILLTSKEMIEKQKENKGVALNEKPMLGSGPLEG